MSGEESLDLSPAAVAQWRRTKPGNADLPLAGRGVRGQDKCLPRNAGSVIDCKAKMQMEDAIKSAVGFFGVILAGALVSSALGGAFAAFIAFLSPEFVSDLFLLEEGTNLIRYALVVGMIWGLFIGAAVSGFACLLTAIVKILKIRFEYKREQKGGQ